MTPHYATERKISLKTAAGLPLWSEKPSYKKLCRWSKQGLRGIKLESHKEAGRVYTSREATQRFATATKEYRSP